LKTWVRADVEAELASRLWTYLSADAIRSDLPAAVEDIWRLEPGEIHQLAAVRLAGSPMAASMLDAAQRILHELPSSLARSTLELSGSVRGPVVWQETRRRRLRTADSTLFVCQPPERRYDTPLARLVSLALRQLLRAAEFAPPLSGGGQLAVQIRENSERARDLLRNRKLDEVRRVDVVPQRTLTALRRRPDAGPLIDFVQDARGALDNADPEALVEVIATQLFAPATDDSLFELLAGFGLIEALETLGFESLRTSAMRGTHRTFAHLARGDLAVEVWWQRSLWDVSPTADVETSQYRSILDKAGMRRSSLRPDFTIVCSDGRTMVVEVKHTLRGEYTPERQGIVDALAYVQDAATFFAGQSEPHALVVAWNATGRPAPAKVIVSDVEQLHQALELFLATHTSQ
jgi:hypothetical protein